jgi:hypothetical protein
MYNFIPANYIELIEQEVQKWLQSNKDTPIIVTPIAKNEAIFSKITDQRGNSIALLVKNTTIYICIEGVFPNEIQEIANDLNGYEKFESQEEALKFIQKINEIN